MASEQHLQQARAELEETVKFADDEGVRNDLRETAAALAAIAGGDREADHAVVDEHLNALRQAERRTDDEETADRIGSAIERVETYRADLEQA